MEGLWIVLGSALSTVSGVVFWVLNSRTARDTQERQQRHDLQMQGQRLDAERRAAQDDALREARRARLQPVFDVLAELEVGQAHAMWKEAIERVEASGEAEKAATQVLAGQMPPEGASKAARDVAREALQELLKEVPPPSKALAMRAAPVVFRIGDETLRTELVALLMSAALEKLGEDALSKMADIHARLEAYVAKID